MRFVVALRISHNFEQQLSPATTSECVRKCVGVCVCVWEFPERVRMMGAMTIVEKYQTIWLPLNNITTNNGTNEMDSASTTTELSTAGTEASQHISAGLLLWVIINFIILVFILGGNILTIVAVRTCRHLRSVISNIFILSLAISDLIVGVALPYHVAFYMSMGTDLGHMRGLCLLRFFLFICACCVSILTLISIAVDRYIAVMYALHYRR